MITYKFWEMLLKQKKVVAIVSSEPRFHGSVIMCDDVEKRVVYNILNVIQEQTLQFWSNFIQIVESYRVF